MPRTRYRPAAPNRVTPTRIVVGIQGGRGSFNEDAARHYMSRTPEVPCEIVYLHTTERVLRGLHEGTSIEGCSPLNVTTRT